MKKNICLVILLAAVFFFCSCSVSYCQKNTPSPWDPSLEANSDKWKLTVHHKMFGDVSQMEFGPYSVALIEKLDSPLNKRKTKGGAEFGLDLGYDGRMNSGHNVDMDLTKKVITEKSKYYRMLLAGNNDTTETLCSVLSITKDEKGTVGGAVLRTLLHGNSGNENNNYGTIGYLEIMNGFILPGTDPVPWNFFFTLGKGENNKSPGTSHSDTLQSFQYFTGYLKNSNDSLYIKTVLRMSVVKVFGKYDTLYYGKGFEIVNEKGEHLAAYEEIGTDKKNPFIWMRKDLSDPYRQAIASFLEVIVYRKEYQNTKAVK